MPINNLLDLARRLEGKQNIPATLAAPANPFTVGNQQSFWVSNVDTNDNFQIDATLQYITDHVYFWIEDGVNFRASDLKSLADTFEHQWMARVAGADSVLLAGYSAEMLFATVEGILSWPETQAENTNRRRLDKTIPANERCLEEVKP